MITVYVPVTIGLIWLLNLVCDHWHLPFWGLFWALTIWGVITEVGDFFTARITA